MPHFSAYAAETPDRPAYIMANSGEVVTYSSVRSQIESDCPFVEIVGGQAR